MVVRKYADQWITRSYVSDIQYLHAMTIRRRETALGAALAIEPILRCLKRCHKENNEIVAVVTPTTVNPATRACYFEQCIVLLEKIKCDVVFCTNLYEYIRSTTYT